MKTAALRRTDGFDIYRKEERNVAAASGATLTACLREQRESESEREHNKSVDLTLPIICVCVFSTSS